MKTMRNILAILLFISIGNFGWAQSGGTQVLDQSLVELRQSLEQKPLATALRHSTLLSDPIWISKSSPEVLSSQPAGPAIPAAWNYHELAFFCKIEVKMEKALNLPVKFRLGEVQAVERKEGKLKTHFAER